MLSDDLDCFFFKQKTAYEMRISDWSSDVCSSDLVAMKHADFAIGTEFETCTGQRWRCTDVARRTIVAIELRPELEAAWFRGPPYPVPERSEERRVGKECVSESSSRWST